MRIDQLVNSKLTPPEELVAASLKLKSWAHQEENYRHLVVDGEGKVVQDRPMDDRHKTRIKLPGWDTKITVVYSVDDLPEWNLDCTFEERLAELEGNLDALNDGLPRRKVRHLSIQISIPGNFTTAQVRMVPEFLQWYEPMVKVFFPLHEQIRATLIAHPAVPVVDKRAAHGHNPVTFRTPLLANFVVDLNDMTALNSGDQPG